MEEKATQEMQEVVSPAPPQPLPRRRLASFGGLSCPESSSLFTGLGAYNQFKDGYQPGATGNLPAYIGSSAGSTQSLKVSPQSSGRSTPVTGLGSVQLQNVREQMVAALQKLKELEEQVKLIPVLELKISILQEDKRQLLYELKKHKDEDTNPAWKMANSQERFDISMQYVDDSVQKKNIQLGESKELPEKVQSVEQQYKPDLLHAWQRNSYLCDKITRSVATGTDKERDFVCCEHHCQSSEKQMRSIAIDVTENNLGINSQRDDEILAQQEIIYSLKDRIGYLEAELKESTLQIEMNRLKLELQAAEERNNKKMNKASSASPSTVNTSIEARPSTKSQAVGNHVTVCDASTGEVTEMKSVGISCCRMILQNVRSGPTVQWVAREMVDTADKNTGFQILATSQGVGTCINLCDTGTNTDKHWSDSGVSSVNVNFSRDHCIDQGVMASAETASQHTNTVRNLVSRFTNTKQAFNTDSITNTVIKSQDKHTNTPTTVTRTVSVGSRVQDIQAPLQTRTIGVGTTHVFDSETLQPNLVGKVTRDASVGFININENFLIGIKTRNMASGPSHLPDPLKTRSIGVGEGKILDSPPKESREIMANQSLKDTELNYYIEAMQRFLTEHKDLLKEEKTCISNQHKSSQRNASPTQLCKIIQERNDGTASDTSETTHKEFQVMGADDDTFTGAKPNEVKRMIQMLEQQTSSTLQDKAMQGTNPWSVCKKKNSDQSCSTSRKNMRLMGVTTGLEPLSPNITSDTGTATVHANKAAIIKTNNEGSKEKKYNKHLSSKRPKGSAKSSLQESCRFKLSEKMLSACQNLKIHLSDGTEKRTMDFVNAIQTLKQEWFNISSQKSAAPHAVEIYLSAFQDFSPLVLQYVVNMADSNGNTALHYCVSYSNFGVVKKLLKTDVCNVNQQNKAGYTPIMLAALAQVSSPEHMSIVKELFSKGDVNAKASQAGQTALMLAVSHGNLEMVQALLEQGAEVNLQDDEGSTALMCASEHGHKEIVKFLLQQPNCDATLTDSDESTALSIALEGGHKEIAMLLYAHANFSKGNTGTSVDPTPPSSPGRRK
ncbi:KN motif and ankyrin repeat domain-containing protein 1-like [Boleophthalmus pectinirostris]|uniref:KN motif and ankyrin repeat domain-containing protein 1-like n=1 Tax=Boleophthalmus pectinirostris TaxID=150288 RepID=UPI00242F391A|nr:KN motif and ankyrin repeat domain-containing protein 1-like [Boleophthalmus pectinirostris]